MNGMAGYVMFPPSKVVVTALVLALASIVVHAQDTSDFISIDCGSTANYVDGTTLITYVPDSGYIDSGVSKSISTQYMSNGLEKHFQNVRSFPDGNRNCYTLKPHQVAGTKYLIRARFLYGNYDSKGIAPEFDLYIGGNFWTTVTFAKVGQIVSAEIVHISASTVTYVCLVNKGEGTPFISVLELRLINKAMYNSTYDSMTLVGRLDLGSSYEYRYSDDIHDRIWTTVDWSDTMKTLTTSLTVKNTQSSFAQPSSVMQTALTPINSSHPLGLFWKSFLTTNKFYIYFHFAEIETLTSTDLRQFTIYLNGEPFSKTLTPLSLSSFCYYHDEPLTENTWYNFTLEKTTISTHPPILNALELYLVTHTSELETDSVDVEAINQIKSAYNLNRIWQGDPCTPKDYTWSGLNCSFPLNKSPRIISLNLSSSNLGGEISAYIYDLKLLQKLDLSNNSLVGGVPEFLALMTSLTYINLRGNNLNGIVPAGLVAKSDKGSLTLIVDGNNLCLSAPCNTSTPPGGKKSSLLIPIVASVIGIIILVVVVLIVILCKVKRKKSQGIIKNNAKISEAAPVVVETEAMPRSVVSVTEPVNVLMPAQNERIQTKNKCFTASEVSNMTNNYSKVIGKGGFGTVYLGFKDGVKVAVKILSASSTQGYKEFKAEAELLMTVHHRNLTSLIGYCDDGNTFGLVYEFMANGNLGSHISDRSLEYLSWEDRLHIAVDSAQGLEYLHNGCRDPIVHRDIKPANILLNEKFEAKIADFGLSRAFSADTNQTVVAGTPGYLDPEYYQTQQLNEKSDVFSFGIVLLEIITSRPVLSKPPERIHISVWASQVLSNQGDIKAILDPRLRGDYDTNSAWKAVEVAMTCVSPTSVKRPSMNQVVSELTQCLNMEKARKHEGFTTDTMDSVEMVSFGANNSYTPSAR